MSGLENKDADIVRAKHYALKLLSYRGRSEKELEERLMKKGLTKPVTSSAIKYLKEIGLIDDMSLAESLKREALTAKLLSQKGAKRYIVSRGIARELADAVFFHEADTDIDNAGRLVDKKLRSLSNHTSEVAKRRLYNLLARRGYSSETIMKVFKDKNFKEEKK